MRYLTVALVVSSFFATTHAAFAQESEREGVALRAEPNPELRLREWLQYRADGSSRTLAIAGGLLGAAGITGFGIYGLVSDSDVLGGSVGRLYIAAGLLSLAAPIVLLATQDHPRLDVQNLPERALTEREIGYYEGLLHGEARLGRALRIGRGVQGALFTVGGGLGFALTLNDGGFSDSPIEAGLYLGLSIGGLISALAAFFKTRQERTWEGYNAGVVPDAESARIRFRGDGVQLTF
ncbi:MAG: hypothetical protein ACI9KE_003362 [Polyangiales bacterium]|jgi:hypothetical protein